MKDLKQKNTKPAGVIVVMTVCILSGLSYLGYVIQSFKSELYILSLLYLLISIGLLVSFALWMRANKAAYYLSIVLIWAAPIITMCLQDTTEGSFINFVWPIVWSAYLTSSTKVNIYLGLFNKK